MLDTLTTMLDVMFAPLGYGAPSHSTVATSELEANMYLFCVTSWFHLHCTSTGLVHDVGLAKRDSVCVM